MMKEGMRYVTGFALACLLVLGLHATAAAQGRGHGGGGGRPSGVGGGPPSGAGVDHGIGNASDRSGGRSDAGLGTASDRSNGRSDAGIERARRQRDNAKRADEELRDHPELAHSLHTTANDLRAGYQAALASNPNLKFGQYVAATRLASNLGATHPAITRDAILAGLASGDSIGQTLRNLGLGKDEAKNAEREADREDKASKRRNH